jgi:hypothetical protein
MIAEESPIDRCELRDAGHRIAVEAGVLLRQQDVVGGGRGALAKGLRAGQLTAIKARMS